MDRVLILCNGRPPAENLFREWYQNTDFFIAADGGGNIARSFNTEPDVIIGDLDSFEETGEESSEIIFDPDQETNDLEKALHYAQKKSANQIYILGATGNRVDHTLKNLSVIKQFDPHFEEIILKDNFGDTRLIPDTFETELKIGTEISLFPLSGKVGGITTSGLKYPLCNEALENGVRDGSSNKVIENPVHISHKGGDLLLFVAR